MFVWGPLLPGSAQLQSSSAIELVPDQTGYQTQLGDEATLGVTIDLVPDGTGYHSQLGDEATLGVTIDLVPDGTAYQEQVGDNATLDVSTTIDLVPDGTGYQENIGDGVTLATELKHIVAPSGGDFTSLDAALDHLRASHSNFVTANVFAVIEIQGSWSSADSIEASTTGLTMDESHFLVIKANTANRASAQSWRTDKYRLSVTGTTQALSLTGGLVFIYLDGIQIELYDNASTGSTTILCDGCSSGSRVYISNVRGRIGSTIAGNGFVFGLADSDPIFKVWNLIAEAHPGNVGSARGYYLAGSGSSGESKGYNLLGIGLDYSYRTTGGQCWSLYDSVACNCNNDFYNAASDFYAVDYCASDDGDGTNPVTPSGGGAWWPNDFFDAANGDYRLKPTSNLVGAASEAGDDYFTTDIDGQTRSNWDVGPHESVDVTLVTAEGVQTQLGDEATLEVTGGTIDIVPDQTGYQTQSGDDATLGVTIDLVPDSTGYQTQLGDEATIVVAPIDIVPAEGVQTQAGDEATLGVTIDLVPDGAGYQTQFGDNVTIEVGVIQLVTDEGYQNQVGDEAFLGVTIDLVPDGTGYQSQLGDNATIEVGVIDLVTAEGVQTQLGDEASLTQTHILSTLQGSDLLTDGGFSNWSSPTNLTSWTESVGGTSSVNREGSSLVEGPYAVRLDIDGSGNKAEIYQSIASLTAGVRYRFSVYHRTSYLYGGVEIQLVIQNTTNYQTLQWDGSWAGGGYISILPNPEYTKYEIDFIAPSPTSGYVIDFNIQGMTQAGHSFYLDWASLRVNQSYQTQLGDVAAISAIIDVVPADGFQTQAGDEATLTIAPIDLLTQDGFNEQIGEEALLSIGLSLIIQGGYQEQSGDDHWLVIGDLSQWEHINLLRLLDKVKRVRVEPKVEVINAPAKVVTARKRVPIEQTDDGDRIESTRLRRAE